MDNGQFTLLTNKDQEFNNVVLLTFFKHSFTYISKIWFHLLRYLFLCVSGIHDHKSTGDGPHHLRSPPQFNEIQGGATMGSGACDALHSSTYLLQFPRRPFS